jgi:hypothetical protein
MQYLLIDYADFANELRDSVRAQDQPREPVLTTRLERIVATLKSESLRGDVVLSHLYAALDSCGLERTATQRFFHKNFVLSALPWVYGPKDFSQFRERILSQNGVPQSDKYNQFTLISTPRRWGKTTSVAVFCAAMLFTVPDAWISVYSTGRRASKSLSDMVHKFIKVLEERAGYKRTRVLVKNTEELFYGGANPADMRRMFSYPATVQARSTSKMKTLPDYLS